MKNTTKGMLLVLVSLAGFLAMVAAAPLVFAQAAHHTNGGSAPATGCSASTDVGKQALVPYTADYYFYAPQR